jgi:hypothetical protein
MALDRRTFICRTLAFGPVAMSFWFERDLAWAAGQCGLPDTSADCVLPNPPPAKPFVPNEPKVLTRWSAFEMTDPARATQLAHFRDAICKVRDLPKDDVIGWTKLVAQHCLHCVRGQPTNIHADWNFLPWHRCLLYFLERNLRKLSGHDDLRLVYWDWESKASRTLPDIYKPANQPLYWANRQLSGPNWPLPDGKVDVQPSLATPDFRTFGGTATPTKPVPLAYSGPHAPVHNAFSPGDMGDLQFSPRDPVFYAHHANIDRLWTSWVAAGHKNPDFGDAKVYFYDEQRVWRSVLLNDLSDESRLGYKYSSLMRPRVALTSLSAIPLARTANHLALAPRAMASLQTQLPKYLFIENLHNPETAPADVLDFGIFVGNPPAGTHSAAFKGFLGLTSRVRSHAHDHETPLSAALDVTGKLTSLTRHQENQDLLDLTVAPLDASGKTTAAAAPLAADDVRLVG